MAGLELVEEMKLVEKDGIFYPKWVITVYNTDPPPKNPLWEKWRSYANNKTSKYPNVCDGYSCMFCGRCPCGEYWKVPEEDKAEYEMYLSKMEEWKKRHPEMAPDVISSQIMIPINTE